MEEKKKLPTTHKKQKFIRIKEYIDPETGEYVPFQENAVEDKDFNFHKVWLRMFVEELDRIANKKMKLAFWIIDHLNKENQLIYTFRRMAEETELSIDTVIKTMKTLQEGNPPFLKKLQSGVYVINPDILYKGNHKSRMGIVYQFGEIPSKYAMEQKKAEEKEENKSENTASDAPKSPQTHETTKAEENVPAKSETLQKQNERKSDFALISVPAIHSGYNCKTLRYLAQNGNVVFNIENNDLPPLGNGTNKQIGWAELIREKFFKEFKEMEVFTDYDPQKFLVPVFMKVTYAIWWIENRENRISQLIVIFNEQMDEVEQNK